MNLPKPIDEITTADLKNETIVRALRDKVYGHASSQKNWDACKEKWMDSRESQWLLNQARSAK